MNLQEISNYLAGRNFNPQLKDNSEIHFKIDNTYYVLRTDPNDLSYVRILVPNIWKKNKKVSAHDSFKKANEISRDYKVGKLFFIEDGLWISIDAYFPNEAYLFEIFDRLIRISNGIGSAFLKSVGVISEA